MSTTLNTPNVAFEATLQGDGLSLRHAPMRRLLSRIRHGRLSLTLPDGNRIEAIGAEPGPRAEIHLHRWRTALRLLLEGDLGLAFSYRDGDWSTPDLVAVLSFGIANEAALGAAIESRGPARWLAKLLHRLNANTRRGSRDNISFHYDLGNAFYERWLDDSMLYSSALYEDEDTPETLESAQARRLDRIVDLMGVQPGERVLEIGCGWGTLAATLARRFGAQVTGVTLSTEQLAFARERAKAWGVADRTDLRLQDYRDVEGRYDRIVSIEMIEAVGETWWPTYFATLRDRLAPGGSALLQSITIAEPNFERYRSSPDFIQRCIFPGGMLPTPQRIVDEAARAGLVVSHFEQFGSSYARTLADWRERFLTEWPRIEALQGGFDERFKRLWDYYLCYCEAGFRSGRVDVGFYQLRHA
jgi:cyclopropane-fatty-acyl-phospholipid synthase